MQLVQILNGLVAKLCRLATTFVLLLLLPLPFFSRAVRIEEDCWTMQQISAAILHTGYREGFAPHLAALLIAAIWWSFGPSIQTGFRSALQGSLTVVLVLFAGLGKLSDVGMSCAAWSGGTYSSWEVVWLILGGVEWLFAGMVLLESVFLVWLHTRRRVVATEAHR